MPVLLYLKAFLRKRAYLLLSLFFAILILLITYGLFCQMIRSKLAERENALRSLPVTVVLSNIAGTQTDHLEIPFYLAEYFTSGEYSYGGEIQPRAFSSYVKDVRLKHCNLSTKPKRAHKTKPPEKGTFQESGNAV